MRPLTRVCCALLGALSLGLYLSPARGAAGANFNVNSLGDTPDALLSDGLCADAGGACTLRAAIQQANADPSADTISFSVTGAVNLTGALPDLSTALSIVGPGAGLLTVRRDTGGDYRVFTVTAVAPAAVAISGLTISNGRTAVSTSIFHSTEPGGGVFNSGSLTLTGCVVSGNSTADAPAVSVSVPGGGGGVYNEGTLVMTGCAVSDNFTGKGGQVSVNRFGGSGGGVANHGTLVMTGCLVNGNRTGDGGNANPDGGDAGFGGGLANFADTHGPGDATLTSCVFSNNRTGNGGNAQAGDNASSGHGGFGGGVYNDGTLRLDRSLVGGNVTGEGGDAVPSALGSAGDGGSGGGLYNARAMTVVNTVVRDNVTGAGADLGGTRCHGGDGGDGGGIASPAGTTLELSHSTIVFNRTGIFTDPCARDGLGGGVFGGAKLRSVIIAANVVRSPSSARNVFGSGFQSFGYNSVEAPGGACCFDFGGTDLGAPAFALKLDPVTLIPQPGSVAIDAGLALDIDGQPVATDARGAARPFDDPTVPPQAGGDDSDIGALERQPSDPSPPLASPATNVHFNAPGGRVTEGCVQASVTVTRSGPLDGRSEVTYVISDKTATQRGDFIRASGRLTFEQGDDSKVIPVLINEDAYAEGPEELTVTLTGLEGGTLSPNPFTLQIDDNDDADGAANPIDDNATFVCQHYHDFLSRHPDASGQAFWTAQLDDCGGDPACLDRKRVDVSAAFFLSIEFQATGYFAIRVNKAAFGDQPANPRYLQFLEETQELARGVVVGQPGFGALLDFNMRRYTEEFVTRADFQAAHGGQDAVQYVDSLFAGAGATPTQAERDAAVSAFGSGDTAGRALSLRSVVESGSVYNRLYNRGFVLMQYFAYLRRNPDAAPDGDFAGYNFWLAKLDEFTLPGEDARDESVALSRVRRAEMVRAFLLSAEYRERFQGDPNRGLLPARAFAEAFGAPANLFAQPDDPFKVAAGL